MNLNARLLREAAPGRLALIANVMACLLTGIAIVLQAYSLSFCIERAFLAGWPLSNLRTALLAFMLVSLFRAGLTWVRTASAQRVANYAKSSLRSRLMTHIFTLGPAFMHAERSGELVNTLAEGVEELDAYFQQYLPQLAAAIVIPIALLGFAFPLEPATALILLLTAPLLPLLLWLIGSAAGQLARRQWGALSRLSAQFIDSLQGMTALKLLGVSRARSAVIADSSAQLREDTLRVLRLAFTSALSMEMLTMISIALVAVQIGLRLLNQGIGFQKGLFVLLLAPEFYRPLRTLGARFHAGLTGGSAAKRIYQILDTSPEETTKRSGKLPQHIDRLEIEFRDVHFSYEGRPRPALHGASFRIPPGGTMALIGPSGGGKSTVAHLLLGFLRPQSGQIAVNGVPLEQLDLAAWRAMITWVPQHPYLFSRSVAENIRLAKPAAHREEVTAAARMAAADRFVRALPQGYDTVIGERGIRLSRGEAQRIALARAFLKDSRLVILDEPSAHLDPEVESLIRSRMETLLAGRTALLIAHRLTAIPRVDQILVMSDGRALEMGSPQELRNRQGTYWQMLSMPGGGP